MEKTNKDMTYNECDKKFARVKLAIGIISIILSIVMVLEASILYWIQERIYELKLMLYFDGISVDFGFFYFSVASGVAFLIAAIMCIVTRNSTKEDYSIITAIFYWLAAFINIIGSYYYFRELGIVLAGSFSIFFVVTFYFGLVIKNKYNLSVKFIWISSILALGVQLFLFHMAIDMGKLWKMWRTWNRLRKILPLQKNK